MSRVHVIRRRQMPMCAGTYWRSDSIFKDTGQRPIHRPSAAVPAESGTSHPRFRGSAGSAALRGLPSASGEAEVHVHTRNNHAV